MQKRISACLCCMLLLPLSASAEEEWQTAYRQFLTDYQTTDGYLPETAGESSFGSRWDLCDINMDGIPELFISPDSSPAFGCRIFCFIDGQMIPLEIREGQTFGASGVTKVCQDMHLIRTEQYRNDTEKIRFYAFDGTALTEVDCFETDSVWSNEAEDIELFYKRNGAVVTEQEYSDGIADYDAHIWQERVGRGISFDDLSVLDDIVPTKPEIVILEPEKPVSMKTAAIWGSLSAVVLSVAAAVISKISRK